MFIDYVGDFWVLQRIPVWWRWYYWASPFAWTLYGLATSQFGDISNEVVMADGGKLPENKLDVTPLRTCNFPKD
jgi:hypothetical protein